MTQRTTIIVICVFSQIFFTVAVAGAFEISEEQRTEIDSFILANMEWSDDQVSEITLFNGNYPEIILAQADDETYDPEEEFYFGPDEEKVREEMLKKKEQLDPVARAHRDVKLYIGIGFIGTAVTMFVLGLIRKDKHLPYDYYNGKAKYDIIYKDSAVPLIVEKEPYTPSMVAGVCLAAGGVYLMTKK